jgi:ssDNA-binding Zn-finger/Zn-ribbon topoisomerase 1
MKSTPETVQVLLKEVYDHFNNEDTAVRERQLRQWKQLKLLWEGFQKTWYSEVAHDWRIWDDETADDSTGQAYYDKPVNVFRAYLESIMAALSVTVPPVKCYPDDADNTLDLSTARAGDKIAKLLYRHNDVPLLWLHGLFIFCTEGMIGCYTYPKSDEKYGTYEKKEYKDDDEEHTYARCPECGYNIGDDISGQGQPGQAGGVDPAIQAKAEQYEDKFMPDEDDVPVLDYMEDGDEMCPACMAKITPLIVKELLTVTRLIGVTKEPKTRICMEAYGGLYLKVPNYARNQADCPYIIFNKEDHFSSAIAKYGELDQEELRGKIRDNRGPKNPYEEWARLSPQYNGEYPNNVVTTSKAWFRPSAFNVLCKEEAEFLQKKYPSGVKVTYVNDTFAEACNEAMDDCWSLTYNPLSDYIHFDPLGLLLVSLQELINDLISLITQTIEHGIGQTFADPGVLNFDAYRQLETVPGGMYEAVPKSGKSLGDGFFEAKTATLSQEVLPFFQQLQNLAQLVSGALPSLFGGAMADTGTASEYSMSRSQALQRLQNTWKMLTFWWKSIFGKAIPMFIEEMVDDEREVVRNSDGGFANTFIRKAETEGKIGRVELEANENLPMTWNQRKDVIMQLLQTGNPEILAMLGTPENLPVVREAIGLDDFYVPGTDDREKQLDEIKLLLNSTPLPDAMTGMEAPSVDVDPQIDNNGLEFEVCRHWLISEEGRQAKEFNPDGYRNVLLHAKMHLVAESMQNMGPEGAGAAQSAKPPEDQSAPISGDSNVQTV